MLHKFSIADRQLQLYSALREFATGWHVKSELTEGRYHKVYDEFILSLAELEKEKKVEIYDPLLRSLSARCQ
jgi:hypothetical protein